MQLSLCAVVQWSTGLHQIHRSVVRIPHAPTSLESPLEMFPLLSCLLWWVGSEKPRELCSDLDSPLMGGAAEGSISVETKVARNHFYPMQFFNPLSHPNSKEDPTPLQ